MAGQSSYFAFQQTLNEAASLISGGQRVKEFNDTVKSLEKLTADNQKDFEARASRNEKVRKGVTPGKKAATAAALAATTLVAPPVGVAATAAVGVGALTQKALSPAANAIKDRNSFRTVNIPGAENFVAGDFAQHQQFETKMKLLLEIIKENIDASSRDLPPSDDKEALEAHQKMIARLEEQYNNMLKEMTTNLNMPEQERYIRDSNRGSSVLENKSEIGVNPADSKNFTQRRQYMVNGVHVVNSEGSIVVAHTGGEGARAAQRRVAIQQAIAKFGEGAEVDLHIDPQKFNKGMTSHDFGILKGTFNAYRQDKVKLIQEVYAAGLNPAELTLLSSAELKQAERMREKYEEKRIEREGSAKYIEEQQLKATKPGLAVAAHPEGAKPGEEKAKEETEGKSKSKKELSEDTDKSKSRDRNSTSSLPSTNSQNDDKENAEHERRLTVAKK